ncbi:hypothetical protein K438DRAFT_1922921 [Mycena galopus ATCC 62051]|nr:hypothetical protein K438DRAFT_1922921 [Mycena galopus ATCC 62051]
MDDVADEARMRDEDAEEMNRGSSGEDEDEDKEGDKDGEDDDDAEVDAIVDAEEDRMIAEAGGLASEDDEDDEDSDSDDDDDEIDTGRSPKSAFQARLERAILDDNGDILSAHSRQGRKKLLKAVASGELNVDHIDFDDEFAGPAKRGKNKRNDLPAELQAIWDKDRAKKAENKRLRALARMEAASDPLAHKKGGKKGRKAMLAAARLPFDPTITPLPHLANRVVDLPSLVSQIRRFVGDIGGPQSMSLPPADKATRKTVHELAIAFRLKSASKGKGEGRYTTLVKTTRSGLGVDEKKVAKILRGGGGGGEFVRWGGEKGNGGGRGGPAAVPRQRDGDEVGKAAPKIGETNIGFRMLAMMGWAEGERIGASADGLHVPLTAVIKNTKLGLGATR